MQGSTSTGMTGSYLKECRLFVRGFSEEGGGRLPGSDLKRPPLFVFGHLLRLLRWVDLPLRPRRRPPVGLPASNSGGVTRRREEYEHPAVLGPAGADDHQVTGDERGYKGPRICTTVLLGTGRRLAPCFLGTVSAGVNPGLCRDGSGARKNDVIPGLFPKSRWR